MGRVGRIGAALAGAVGLALVLAQVLLPRLAASRISSRVARYGTVESVSVSAWPAVKLLWGSSDSVHVHARDLAMSPSQAASLLSQAHGTDKLEASVEGVQLGPLHLEHASLSKQGEQLHAQALASQANVSAALPENFDVQLLRSGGGEVEVLASGALFGVGASVNALALASEGRLVAHPRGFLIEALQLTLFSNPHVYVEGVGASVETRQPLTYRLTMDASLR
jgi:hypothetical protein